jgi:3-hydroxyacyl-CoA dehydrogenase
MPGAGGTQRLVRALPLERALGHLLRGDVFRADSAVGEALLHDVVDAAELESAAIRAIDFALTQPSLPRLRDISLNSPAAEITLSAAEQLLARKKLLSTAASHVLNAVRIGCGDFDAGVRAEYESFFTLANTTAARALRYRFMALRAVRRRAKTPHHVTSVAVIGAGTMGRDIAALFARDGLTVTIVDTNSEVLEAAVVHAREVATGEVRAASQIADLPAVDLVVEAVVENLDVKRKVFDELSKVLPADTVIATNTSSMDIDDIAAAASRPDRVLGMHFFSPVLKMELVEVIAGAATDRSVIDRCRALLLALSKTPVVVNNGPSFVGNRVFDRYVQEAHMLQLEGVPAAEVDAAAIAIGMPAGPFRVLDSIGIDIPHHARVQRGTADDAEWSVARRLLDQGRLGRKSGAGWYSYADGASRRDTSHADALAEVVRAELGIVPTPLSSRQIERRLLMALVAEARTVVAGGIAHTPADVDVIMNLGYGMRAELGGPIFLAAQMGEELVSAELAALASQPGAFSPNRWTAELALAADGSAR